MSGDILSVRKSLAAASGRSFGDDRPDVDADRLHGEIAHRLAFEALKRRAIADAAQKAYVQGEPSPVCYYVGTIHPRTD